MKESRRKEMAIRGLELATGLSGWFYHASVTIPDKVSDLPAYVLVAGPQKILPSIVGDSFEGIEGALMGIRHFSNVPFGSSVHIVSVYINHLVASNGLVDPVHQEAYRISGSFDHATAVLSTNYPSAEGAALVFAAMYAENSGVQEVVKWAKENNDGDMTVFQQNLEKMAEKIDLARRVNRDGPFNER